MMQDSFAALRDTLQLDGGILGGWVGKKAFLTLIVASCTLLSTATISLSASQSFLAYAICASNEAIPSLSYNWSSTAKVSGLDCSLFCTNAATETASCDAGQQVMGGGFILDNASLLQTSVSTPDLGSTFTGTGWSTRGVGLPYTTSSGYITSVAVCTATQLNLTYPSMNAQGTFETVLYNNCGGHAALGVGGRVVRDDGAQTWISKSVPDPNPDKGGGFIDVVPQIVSGDYVSVVCSEFPVSPLVPPGAPPAAGPSGASALPIVQGSRPGFMVTFASALPGQGQVIYGPGPGCPTRAYRATHDAGAGMTSHRILVVDDGLPSQPRTIEPGAIYSYKVVTLTRGGGIETDDNGGACYTVTIPTL